MLQTENLNVRWYFLPEDSDACQQEFLNLLNGGYDELWISAFGFTLEPMFAAIKAADEKGVKIHILLDRTQAGGTTEKPLVQDLVSSLKNGDVTITTAGTDSKQKSQIYHWKAMVAKFNDGNTDLNRFGLMADAENPPAYFCWQGSVNFSNSGFNQGNDSSIFADTDWGTAFIANFEAHKAWALENEPQSQLKP